MKMYYLAFYHDGTRCWRLITREATTDKSKAEEMLDTYEARGYKVRLKTFLL
jgi:hypothetical protein